MSNEYLYGYMNSFPKCEKLKLLMAFQDNAHLSKQTLKRGKEMHTV